MPNIVLCPCFSHMIVSFFSLPPLLLNWIYLSFKLIFMIKEDFCWCFRGIEENYQFIKKNQNDNICVDFFFFLTGVKHASQKCSLFVFCSTNNPKYRNLVCNPKTQWITSCFCFGCYKVTESFIVKVVSSWIRFSCLGCKTGCNKLTDLNSI